MLVHVLSLFVFDYFVQIWAACENFLANGSPMRTNTELGPGAACIGSVDDR